MKTRLTLLTSLSLLLAACGQPTAGTTSPAAPVATSPAPATSSPTPARAPFVNGAVYQVSFQGVGGDGLTAQAQAVRSGLDSQALQSAPENLTFTLLSRSTFTVQSTGKRYVKATFQVQNTTGQTLTNLKFIPVDTDEDSAGPSNNGGSVPTVGSTSFNNVTYFDGSDASSKAASLNPGQGQNFNAASGAAEADSGASTFATGLDTSGLSVTPPTGLLVAGVKNYGWNVASSLAPSATANVTFAVDLPLDSAGPSKDPFNFSLVFTAAQDGPTPISAIQGSTPSGDAVSPLSGKTVTVQGVVTAVSQGSFGTGGFYIETPDADQDSDASTSEGLYVACASSCYAPNVGDVVRVNGTVSEINTQTVLTAATGGVTLNGTAPLPTPVAVTLPLSTAGALEAYEGMRVRVKGVVSNNYTLGRFNTLTVADARPYSYTQKNSPSVSGYAAYIADLQKRTVLVDDLNIGQNPPANFGDNNQPLSASNTLRTGDSADVTGVVSYGWAGGASSLASTDALGYRVLTTQQDATFTGTRPAAPVVSGNLTVAGANVLNFFTTLNGSAANSCTSNGNDSAASLKARGANDCTEYTRQLDKVVSNLAGLNADVTGLMEVQNDATVGSQGNDYSLVTLVAALNTRLGGDVYGIVNNPNPGTDAIRVAMIYKKANVTPVGTALNDTNTINSRYPLAQVFQAAGGSKFAVVVNHLKSKGSGTGTGNSDIGDGQGGSAAMREQQVVRLLDLIQNRIVAPTSAGGLGVANVIAVGDFNAYDQEPSLVNLRKGQDGAAGTADDLSDVFGSDVYSYQFDGQFGNLDHAFVTQSMKGLLSGGEKWHDNSDEPTVLDYNTEFKSNAQDASYYDNGAYRSSDHDPLKVGFNLTALGTLGVTPNGNSTAYTGQSYTLNTPTTGTPDTLDIDWGDGSSDLGLPGSTTSRAHTYATTGTPTITVTARRGSETATGTQNVTVTSPSIAVSAASSVAVNNTGSTTASNTVNVSRSGFAGSVSLSTSVSGSGIQPAVTVTAQPGTGNSGTVSIDGNRASAGSYTVTVTASGTGVSDATTTFTVNVSAASTTAPKVNHLVISQMYGGGGSSSATAAYQNDYIEIFNPTNATISYSSLSIQYASATGTSWSVSALNNVTIPAGRYYLVKVGTAGTGGAVLGTQDATGSSSQNISNTAGKVALVVGSTALSGTPTAGSYLDLIGFGSTASASETAPAPAPTSVATSLFRALNGCTDSDNNSTDFTNGTAAPRNSATPANVCP